MDELRNNLIQTKFKLQRLYFDKKIDRESYDILIKRNFNALEIIHNL